MKVDQLASVKRWQVQHRRQSPLEYHAWDAVLTLWLLGWVGLAPAAVLHWSWLVAACAPLAFAPSLYVACRRRLHRSGRLRCDWLPALG